jgi:hypothetical protein
MDELTTQSYEIFRSRGNAELNHRCAGYMVTILYVSGT